MNLSRSDSSDWLDVDSKHTGSSEPEVWRRIALAKSCFNLLDRGIWHSSMSFSTKVPTISYLYPTSYIIRLWNMGPNTSIRYTDQVTNATIWLRAGSPLQLSQPIQTRWLWFFGHMARMDTSLDINLGLPKDWSLEASCPPRRPRHTWLCTPDADLQSSNFGLNSAWQCAQDRVHWKHLVETATLQLGACACWWF